MKRSSKTAIRCGTCEACTTLRARKIEFEERIRNDPKEGAAVRELWRSVVQANPCPRAKKPPTIGTMRKWVSAGVARATDGCKVEPDGVCSHGKQSWLLVVGVI